MKIKILTTAILILSSLAFSSNFERVHLMRGSAVCNTEKGIVFLYQLLSAESPDMEIIQALFTYGECHKIRRRTRASFFRSEADSKFQLVITQDGIFHTLKLFAEEYEK